jgi:chromosome segregation ATPase
MKFKLFSMNDELEEERLRIKELESKISEKLDSVARKDFEIEKLKHEKQKAIIGLRGANSGLKDRISELEAQIRAMTGEKSRLTLDFEKLGEKLARMQQSHENTLNVLRARVDEERAATESKLAALKHDISAERNNYKAIIAEEKSKARKIVEFEKAKSDALLKSIIKERAKLEADVAVLQASKLSAEESTQKMRLELETEKVKADQYLKAAEDYERRTRQELDSVLKSKSVAEEQVKELHDGQQLLMAERKKLAAKLQKALRTKSQQKQDAAERLKAERSRLVEQMEVQKQRHRLEMAEELGKVRENLMMAKKLKSRSPKAKRRRGGKKW